MSLVCKQNRQEIALLHKKESSLEKRNSLTKGFFFKKIEIQ